tara:strand:+ start:2530 stop:3450 length:921 start_codon:yes stop_codon:yes gene_type:complete
MSLDIQQRRLIHQKSKQPTFGSGKPDKGSGNEGDIAYRKIQGSGTVQYLKQDGEWIAISSSGEMPKTRLVGRSSSTLTSVSNHSSLGGLLSDDHTQYLLVDGTRAMTGDLSLGGGDGALTFTANNSSIKIPDNKSASLVIEEADTAYLTFVTTDSGEKITLGKKLEAGSVEIEGSAFDIDGGAIDGTPIGANSHTTIKGTTIDATTDFTIGGTVITDGNIDDTGTLNIDGATGVILQEGGGEVIKIDTDRDIFFNQYAQTLFQQYGFHNKIDNYHQTSGRGDFQQNYSIVSSHNEVTTTYTYPTGT